MAVTVKQLNKLLPNNIYVTDNEVFRNKMLCGFISGHTEWQDGTYYGEKIITKIKTSNKQVAAKALLLGITVEVY